MSQVHKSDYHYTVKNKILCYHAIFSCVPQINKPDKRYTVKNKFEYFPNNSLFFSHVCHRYSNQINVALLKVKLHITVQLFFPLD